MRVSQYLLFILCISFWNPKLRPCCARLNIWSLKMKSKFYLAHAFILLAVIFQTLWYFSLFNFVLLKIYKHSSRQHQSHKSQTFSLIQFMSNQFYHKNITIRIFIISIRLRQASIRVDEKMCWPQNIYICTLTTLKRLKLVASYYRWSFFKIFFDKLGKWFLKTVGCHSGQMVIFQRLSSHWNFFSQDRNNLMPLELFIRDQRQLFP